MDAEDMTEEEHTEMSHMLTKMSFLVFDDNGDGTL